MANPYTEFSSGLVTVLQAGLSPLYSGIATRKGIWKPRNLLPFDRYLVFVAPVLQDPVREVRVQSTKRVNEILKADIFLLVKNYDEEQSVYGDTAPNLGVWQLYKDTKDILRNTDLNGLVERNYREVEGGSAFETGASGGFDSGGHGWVHRIRLTYTAYMFSFCHPA